MFWDIKDTPVDITKHLSDTILKNKTRPSTSQAIVDLEVMEVMEVMVVMEVMEVMEVVEGTEIHNTAALAPV